MSILPHRACYGRCDGHDFSRTTMSELQREFYDRERGACRRYIKALREAGRCLRARERRFVSLTCSRSTRDLSWAALHLWRTVCAVLAGCDTRQLEDFRFGRVHRSRKKRSRLLCHVRSPFASFDPAQASDSIKPAANLNDGFGASHKVCRLFARICAISFLRAAIFSCNSSLARLTSCRSLRAVARLLRRSEPLVPARALEARYSIQ